MIKTNDVVQKEKNLSGAGNSQKTKVLKNDLNTDYNSIILGNTDCVKFGQADTIIEKKIVKNYGNNIIGEYVRGIDGSKYIVERNNNFNSETLLEYILYHRGGLFKKKCYDWQKENNIDFNIEDLLQTMLEVIIKFTRTRTFNENGEFYDSKDIIVKDVLAYASEYIINAFIQVITRKNNKYTITQEQIKKLNKFRKYARDLEKEGVYLDRIDTQMTQKILEEVECTLEELIEISHLIKECTSLDANIDENEDNSMTILDTIVSIDEGFNRVEDNVCFGITNEDCGTLNLPLYEINSVDRAVIYLYKANQIDDLKLDIYKSDREFHTEPRSKQNEKVRVDNKELAKKYNCSSNKIYKNRLKLESMIKEVYTKVQGGVSLD